MSFFNSTAHTPEPEPSWFGPPAGVVGGVAQVRETLVQTDRLAIVAHRFVCYPIGVEFILQLWFATVESMPRSPHVLFHGAGQDGGLRFGVHYPDGSKWTNLTSWQPTSPSETPPIPTVFPKGGSGGRQGYAQELWMWPLPEEGTMQLVVAWPERDIEEQSTTIETVDLRRAAAEAETIWGE